MSIPIYRERKKMTMGEQFTKAGDGLLVRAPGKINLSLLVAGKRPDGYHNIESIMAKINWYDEILIEPGDKAGIELICQGPYPVPEGEDNLVYKAVKLILETAGQTVDVRLTLTKNMPAGSGLGSGSSNAAATLMGINKFFKLGIGKRGLTELAAKLGSDVTFFLDGPLALCTGRGEKVKKLAECEFRALLIVPIVSVSTKRVYGNYRHDEAKYGRLREEINLYIEKNRIDLVCSMCANMLAESCFELHTELEELEKRIESLGVRPVCLSGSGSSMFCIINRSNEEGIKTYRDKLEQESGCKSIIVNNNSW
jgi:4-diphosphocytidyl-2-C-methyl-D-erythritol kinase